MNDSESVIHLEQESPQEIIERFLDDPKLQVFMEDLESHSPDYFDHSSRMAEMCSSLVQGDMLDLKDEDKGKLVQATFLHDIGKLDIDRSILENKIPLKDLESVRQEEIRAAIQAHPRGTFNRLKEAGRPDLAQIAVAHHEFQGKESEFLPNYPRSDVSATGYEGQQRKEVSPEVRNMQEILAIIDKIDAMLSPRSYHEGLEPDIVREKVLRGFAEDTSLGLEKLEEVIDSLISSRQELS